MSEILDGKSDCPLEDDEGTIKLFRSNAFINVTKFVQILQISTNVPYDWTNATTMLFVPMIRTALTLALAKKATVVMASPVTIPVRI